jgi:hypothetical protein
MRWRIGEAAGEDLRGLGKVLSLGVGLAGVAGAQRVEEGPLAQSAEASIVEAQVEEQEALLKEQIGEITAGDAELEEAQSQ